MEYDLLREMRQMETLFLKGIIRRIVDYKPEQRSDYFHSKRYDETEWMFESVRVVPSIKEANYWGVRQC